MVQDGFRPFDHCFVFLIFLYVNAFWTKAAVLNEFQTFFSSKEKAFNIFLPSQDQQQNYAIIFRCSLAIIIVFSSIIAGWALQICIVSFFRFLRVQAKSTNCKLWRNTGWMLGMTIFLCGNFLSLALCVQTIQRVRRGHRHQQAHELHSSFLHRQLGLDRSHCGSTHCHF